MDYATGHSIGGAAATLLAKTYGSAAGALVTFGSPAVFPPTYVPTKVKGLYSMAGDSFTAIDTGRASQKMQWTAPTEVGTTVTGIRYFHAFDPVPGYYWAAGYKHGISEAYYLYDTEGECTHVDDFTPETGYLWTEVDGAVGQGTVS